MPPFVAMIPQTRRAIAALLSIAVLSGGCGSSNPASPVTPPAPSGERPVLPATYRASGHAAAGDVFVHLFEWKWTDIGSECERVLGPAGYKAVQVSPPQEHIIASGFPWWVRYQPVSYSIDRSRSGTRADFVAMVNRCRAAGVQIYVDAVINHMTAGAGTGSNGTVYTKYNYPGLYAETDFHTPCSVSNYQSAANVQDCELFGLADLNTAASSVQQKIAGYLIALARLGVAGFRIDAAKHIQPVELDGILARVDQALAADGLSLPYYFGEVIDYGGEAVTARDYYGLAYASGGASDLTEFRFRRAGETFLGTGGQRLSQLNPSGGQGSQFSETAWGLMPSNKAVVFLENHDTQRSDGIEYRDGQLYRLASVWMLAQPYGYPSIMSSYAYDRGSQAGRDRGPPSDAAGATNDVTCATSLETATIGQWVCEHRDPYILPMVRFRRAVAGTDVNHWWDDGSNAIAFSRGDRGFVAINRESAPVSATIATGLPAGSYCDLLSGGRDGTACRGSRLTIDGSGLATISLGATSAIAIDDASRL